MQTYLLEALGETHKIQMEVSAYGNGNLAVLMKEPYSGDGLLWSKLTVNLSVICPSDCAFVDTNRNGESITDWIISNGIGEPTGRQVCSGHCMYPEFHFHANVLREQENAFKTH